MWKVYEHIDRGHSVTIVRADGSEEQVFTYNDVTYTVEDRERGLVLISGGEAVPSKGYKAKELTVREIAIQACFRAERDLE